MYLLWIEVVCTFAREVKHARTATLRSVACRVRLLQATKINHTAVHRHSTQQPQQASQKRELLSIASSTNANVLGN